MSTKPLGVWLVTSYDLEDHSDSPEAAFDSELRARRWSDLNGKEDDVSFLPYGVLWIDRWKNGVDPDND